MTDRSVTVVEPGWKGHRLEFVRFAVLILRDAGVPVRFVTSEAALDSVEFAQSLADLDLPVTTGLLPDSTLRRQLRNTWWIARHVRSGRVVVLHADRHLPAWWMLRLHHPSLGLLLLREGTGRLRQVGFRRWTIGTVKLALVGLARRSGVDVGILRSSLSSDPLPGRWARIPVVLDPSGVLPAPGADDGPPDAVFERWRASGARPVVGVVGELGDRKHVTELLAAAPGNFRLVLAGHPVSDDARHRIERDVESAERRDPGCCYCDLRRVAEAELDDYIASVDVLALLYRNEAGSSGMLARARRLGTPVIAHGNRTVVDHVRAAGGGVELGVVDTDSIAAAVRRVTAGGSGGRVERADTSAPVSPGAVVAGWWRLLTGHDRTEPE